MTTTLDDRVRVLMARLGDATPIAPEFESLTSHPMAVVAAPTSPARSWAPLVAAAAAVALVVGAIALYPVRENDTTSAITPSTKQVATDLPDGWSLVKAIGPGTRVEDIPFGRTNLYATAAAPLGPVVGLSADSLGGERVDAATTTLPDGRRVVLSGEPTGVRYADVEVTAGNWTTMRARGLDDATILQLGASISAEGDQLPTFATDAVASASLTLVGASDFGQQPFWVGADSDAASAPEGTTVTRYAPAGGSEAIDVTTFVPTALSRAALGLWTDASATEGGVIGHLPRQDGLPGYYAERDGFAFFATGPATMIDEIKALVASMAPVSDAQWQRLVGDGSLQPTDSTPVNEAVPETTSVDTTAAPQPSGSSTVDITAVAAPTSTPGEYSVVLTAPDGTTTTFTVRYLGRTITVESDPALGEVLTTDIDVAPRSSGSSGTNGGGFGFVTANAPASSDAVRMSVVADGVRYRITLVQPDPTYPVKLGLFMVRTTAEVSTLDPILLDKNGNQTYGV